VDTKIAAAERKLAAPSGQTAAVLTVWIVDDEQTAPRFVTAYPSEEAQES